MAVDDIVNMPVASTDCPERRDGLPSWLGFPLREG
jgi:hypothetical protein